MVNERTQRRIERLLNQIDAAEASSDWQQVIDLARDVLAVDDVNRKALAYLQTAESRLRTPFSGDLAFAIPEGWSIGVFAGIGDENGRVLISKRVCEKASQVGLSRRSMR